MERPRRGGAVTKLKVLKTVNIFLFSSVLTQALAGIVLFFFDEGRFVMFCGKVHRYNGILLLMLITSHLYLNWPVIVSHYFKKTPVQTKA